MKRYTRKTGTVHSGDHRKAFDHAAHVLKSLRRKRQHNEKAHCNRQGQRIRFIAALETENAAGFGGSFDAHLTITGGFLLNFPGHLWERTEPRAPEKTRFIDARLAAYRQKLTAWQAAAGSSALTFRSFNLLLAALSWDVARESVSPHRD